MKNLLLILVSLFLSLFIAEALSRIFFINKNSNLAYDRYMLFSEDLIFENFKNFTKYYPNKKILSETYYYKNDNFIKEYSYYIKTNNLGLVQDNHINFENESVLFLGDSFTEGQGSEAWINKFNGKFNAYQVVNGGILGTGPEHFYNLENYLSNIINIKKVVFIFIGNDYLRKNFKINSNTQNCLLNSSKCIGNENFYGFNIDQKKNIYAYLKKLKKYRDENATFKAKTKNYIKKINLVTISNIYYDRYFNREYKSKFENNINKTNKLIDKYNKNIIFIRLNTKQEIIADRSSYWSMKAENEIKKKNKPVYFCDFNNDKNLFYKFDDHPNVDGYKYLYNCIKNILDQNL